MPKYQRKKYLWDLACEVNNKIYKKKQKFKSHVDIVQSNYEGKLIDCIQSAYGLYQGIIINPAAPNALQHSFARCAGST